MTFIRCVTCANTVLSLDRNSTLYDNPTYFMYLFTVIADHIMLYDNTNAGGSSKGPFTDSKPTLGSFDNKMSSFTIVGEKSTQTQLPLSYSE